MQAHVPTQHVVITGAVYMKSCGLIYGETFQLCVSLELWVAPPGTCWAPTAIRVRVYIS